MFTGVSETKMEAVPSSKTVVNIYQTTPRHHIPEDGYLYSDGRDNPKCHTAIFCVVATQCSVLRF
jgi:hypothetical protein